jgi:hypothetical protein
MWASPEVKGQPAKTYAAGRGSSGGEVLNVSDCAQAARQRASTAAGSYARAGVKNESGRLGDVSTAVGSPRSLLWSEVWAGASSTGVSGVAESCEPVMISKLPDIKNEVQKTHILRMR